MHPITNKSDTPLVVRDTLMFPETQSGHKVRNVRSDNGSEYINEYLDKFYRDKGIKVETTIRYTPEQNGAAERLNRTLLDKVRSMLASASLPKNLWAEAVVTANYVRNRSRRTPRNRPWWSALIFNGSGKKM